MELDAPEKPFTFETQTKLKDEFTDRKFSLSLALIRGKKSIPGANGKRF
jgi:hypothetical protein